jgi:hypothetical protein
MSATEQQTAEAPLNLAGGTVVHRSQENVKRPVCKPGTHSGFNTTGRRTQTSWTYTRRPVTCKNCLAK